MHSKTNLDDGARISGIVEHAAHLLPLQGPIGVFIHHNTLHAFQHLPFEQAVTEASRIFDTEPYMSEEQYRAELVHGRIRESDIDAVLAAESDRLLIGGIASSTLLRKLILMNGYTATDHRTIEWELEEGKLRPATQEQLRLLELCLKRTPPAGPAPSRPVRDLDSHVHPLLISLCAAFLDQGMAYWPMPDRDEGFYRAVRQLWSQPGVIEPVHLRGLRQAFTRQAQANLSPVQAVLESLSRLHVTRDQWGALIESELLALPGWAGLMHRLSAEPELAPHERVPCSLLDFLAVRLTLVATAATNTAASPAAVTSGSTWTHRLLKAAQLYEASQLLAITADMLEIMSDLDFERLSREVEQFDDIERRRILHLAYERTHEQLILGPLRAHRLTNGLFQWTSEPEAQVFFCIDEREESMRRHLEETAPEIETLSAAGFYGVAVDYAGIDDAHGAPFCPVVVKPQHAVRERPVAEHHDLFEQRQALRAVWARLIHNLGVSSRTLVRGTISTAALGIFSLFPLIAHVLTPRRYGNLMRALNRWILPEPRTELTIMRSDSAGHHVTENLLLGFSIPEKIDRVASVLGPAGLYTRFAPLVVVLGHGSTSLNNPHESAHDCGACGGRRGGPNARLFAAMANHPEVRKGLAQRGIVIPAGTWFVGGYHDTCSDDVEYFDLEELPAHLLSRFEHIRAAIDRARALEAHERARRFEACSRRATPSQALWHVQERSEHLAEPRPEYGHCTNAVCIVGRRDVTRGLFFDRRAFMVSYDATLDPGGENLGRLLAAAIPVCAGISLEYYFSYVDNEGYGCGTKLPHNVTGLVGVMNGAQSDLRTGLPWQMVEIHEPVRCLFIIETSPEKLMNSIRSNSLIMELLNNRWIRVATIDPYDGAAYVWRDGHFEPAPLGDCNLPSVPTSAAWYAGRIEHLPVARIAGTQVLQ